MKYEEPIVLNDTKKSTSRKKNRFIVEYRLPHYKKNLWVVMTRVDTKEEMNQVLKRKYFGGIIVRGREPAKNRSWKFYSVEKEKDK